MSEPDEQQDERELTLSERFAEHVDRRDAYLRYALGPSKADEIADNDDEVKAAIDGLVAEGRNGAKQLLAERVDLDAEVEAEQAATRKQVEDKRLDSEKAKVRARLEDEADQQRQREEHERLESEVRAEMVGTESAIDQALLDRWDNVTAQLNEETDPDKQEELRDQLIDIGARLESGATGSRIDLDVKAFDREVEEEIRSVNA